MVELQEKSQVDIYFNDVFNLMNQKQIFFAKKQVDSILLSGENISLYNFSRGLKKVDNIYYFANHENVISHS